MNLNKARGKSYKMWFAVVPSCYEQNLHLNLVATTVCLCLQNKTWTEKKLRFLKNGKTFDGYVCFVWPLYLIEI